MRRIGPAAVVLLLALFTSTFHTAAAGWDNYKISLRLTSGSRDVRDMRPPLGALHGKRVRVVSLGDARLADDPAVVGERMGRNGRMQVWTADQVPDAIVDASREILETWGVDVVESDPDYVLGIALARCYVYEDDVYDAGVLLRTTLETPRRQTIWQSQVAGNAQVAGRRMTEAVYNDALSSALAQAVSNLVRDVNLQQALASGSTRWTEARAPRRAGQATAPAGVAGSGSAGAGSSDVVRASDEALAARAAGDVTRVAGRAVTPGEPMLGTDARTGDPVIRQAPAAGTPIVEQQPNGTPLVTQVAPAPAPAAPAPTAVAPPASAPAPAPAPVANVATPSPATATESAPATAAAPRTAIAGFAESTIIEPSKMGDTTGSGTGSASGAAPAGETTAPAPVAPTAVVPAPVAAAPAPAPAARSGRRAVAPAVLIVELTKLAQSGADKALIVAFARQRSIEGEFTADEVIALRQAGLDDAVVRAVIERK